VSAAINAQARRLEEAAMGLLAAGWDMHRALEAVVLEAAAGGAEVTHLLLVLKGWEGVATCLLERPDLDARAAALDRRLDEIEARQVADRDVKPENLLAVRGPGVARLLAQLCPTCEGAGEVIRIGALHRDQERPRACPSCAGRGHL